MKDHSFIFQTLVTKYQCMTKLIRPENNQTIEQLMSERPYPSWAGNQWTITITDSHFLMGWLLTSKRNGDVEAESFSTTKTPSCMLAIGFETSSNKSTVDTKTCYCVLMLVNVRSSASLTCSGNWSLYVPCGAKKVFDRWGILIGTLVVCAVAVARLFSLFCATVAWKLFVLAFLAFYPNLL